MASGSSNLIPHATRYVQVVRRRTLTKWTNSRLEKVGIKVDDIIDLEDCDVTAELLSILSGKNIAVPIFERKSQKRQKQGWKNICHFLASRNFPAKLLDPFSFHSGEVDSFVALVWSLVLYFLIVPQQEMLGRTESSARDFILAWVREKLPNITITNFGKDWEDGVLICELVNSMQPGLIPQKLYSDKTKAEENAKLGMQIAHEAFGIPQVISSFDLASSQLDDVSLLTYLALFCKYESLTKGVASRTRQDTQQSKADTACKAYGAGLKSSELGKIAEFVVELNGAKPTDITIAIECKPLRGAVHEDKPDLSVKPLSKNTYCVKYLPSRPGDYVISILHCGAHILRSPFYLTVPETNAMNSLKTPFKTEHHKDASGAVPSGNEVTLTPSSQSPSTTSGSSSQLSSPEQSSSSEEDHQEPSSPLTNGTVSPRSPLNFAEGPGLVAGEVGRVGRFKVVTDNTTKGPLSVCISCPAVSIPVPYVKSAKKHQVTEHSVLYIPTEPGAYEVFIKWGDWSINGSPFKVYINSVSENGVHGASGIADDLGGRGRIRVYYSATSRNPKVRKDNELLEKLLREKGITTRDDFDPWIALDVGMGKADRDKVFSKAATRQTPMVFCNDVYIGGYEDVLILDKQGVLDKYLMPR